MRLSPSRNWLIAAANGVAVFSIVAAVQSGESHRSITPAVLAVTTKSDPKSAERASSADRPITGGALTKARPAAMQVAAKSSAPAPREKVPAAEFQLGRQVPVGWAARQTETGGMRETMIYFQVPKHPRLEPSIHFHRFSDPILFWSNDVRAWLRASAEAKEAQRVREGFADYHNRAEMTPRVIGNRAALSWSADFTRNGEPWVENLTRLFSPAGTALFFLQAPAAEIEEVQSFFDIVIESSVLPTLAVSTETRGTL